MTLWTVGRLYYLDILAWVGIGLIYPFAFLFGAVLPLVIYLLGGISRNTFIILSILSGVIAVILGYAAHF